MKVTVQKSIALGKAFAPPSKSMAHRLLLAAALAEGTSVIEGISRCRDVLATEECLAALGVEIERAGDTVKVVGRMPRELSPTRELPCCESGSTLRFLIPLLWASGAGGVLSGAESLMARPMSVYEKIASEHGLLYRRDGNKITVGGKLTAGEYSLPGNISSQFITGLLYALPALAGESVIRLTTPLESRSYVLLTIDALSAFGVHVYFESEDTIRIPGGQRFHASRQMVEGDFSGAAFLDALNYLGGKVEVMGLRPDSLQGDRVYREYFRKIDEGSPTLDITDCPDLAPILFALACAKGGAHFVGTSRLKIKESDRAAVMACELRKLGAVIELYENEVKILPSELHAPTALLSGHNDHRIVMALAVLLTTLGGSIEGAEAVEKSFPDFFERLASLGIEVLYDT